MKAEEKMNEPKVSVIVPIYNTENELPGCVQSILDQTFSDIEIILVDDGSTDSCPQMCDTYAEQDSRVLVLHKENGGLSDARNTGLLAAKGEYILYVDSDDYIEKEAVEQLLRGDLPGVDLIAGALSNWHGDRQTIQRRTGFEDGKIYTAKDFIITSVINRVFIITAWSFMYRRNYLIENKLFYKKGVVHEDLYLSMDLLLHADGIIYIDFPFYNYVEREGSISRSNSIKKIRDNVFGLKHWIEIIGTVKDSTLQKYLYSELISNYLFMCGKRNLIGWWVPGMNYPFAFIHAMGWKQKVKVSLFELKSIYYSLFPPRFDSQPFLNSQEYKQLLTAENVSLEKGETGNE